MPSFMPVVPLFIEPLSIEPFSVDPPVMPGLVILSCWAAGPRMQNCIKVSWQPWRQESFS